MMSDAQQCLVRLREVSLGTSLTLEASIQSASPTHCILTNGIAQEEEAIDAEVVATFRLEVLRRINFAVDFLLELVLKEKLFCEK